jgi:uncharacterized protein (TIGR04255 family)
MAETDQLPPPFSGPPPEEVPLARAPLVRVLAQIRFPTVLAVTDPIAVAPFQERIRKMYPSGDKEVIQVLQLNPENPHQAVKVEAESIWRFQDREKHWRVSLAPTFLALETTHYTSRKDFLSRMKGLIEALEQTLNPQLTQRVGLRYIDRIEDDAIERVHQLIKPEFLGSQARFGQAVRHILTESQLSTEEGATLTARWALLPPNATTDPRALEPAKGKSWVLDLDMHVDGQVDFAAATLTRQLEQFAERIYAVFRFMVTDQFLEHYGRD